MEKTKEKKTKKGPLVYLLIAAFVAWILYWIIIAWFIPGGFENRGIFGDMFGGINALFSALAFAGLIYAIFLQKEELSLQRQELAETREEIKGQKEQLRLQNETMQRERFENTLFNLLELNNRIVDFIRFQNRVGRACFENLYANLKNIYSHERDNNPDKNYNECINKAFIQFSRSFGMHLNNYLQNVYHIFKFIHTSAIKEKESYISIARAQLTFYEIAILFYFGLSEQGKEFNEMIYEYSILCQIDENSLLDHEHYKLYGRNAYGKQGI